MSDKEKIAQDKQTRQREKRPEWAPEDGGKGFACRVQDGVAARHDGTLHTQEQVPDGRALPGPELFHTAFPGKRITWRCCPENKGNHAGLRGCRV